MTDIAILTHPDCLRHDPGPGHPESPARLEVVLGALKASAFAGRLSFIDAPLASEAQLRRAHTARHVQHIRETAPGEDYAALDGDTVMSPGSRQAALRAAGAGCAAVDLLMKAEARSAFCAVRPPGHHATSDRAMGFCLFNNIAIAAAHAMAEHGLERIAIVDFDVHHGNGTEAIFEQDARVLFISTHQWPLWPGTGSSAMKGAGNILNIPLPPGADGAHYRAAFTAQALSAIRAHRPQLILASAGFDAHARDPLAGLRLVEEDYGWIGGQLATLAAAHRGGKVISFMEGGYQLDALAASVVAYLEPFGAKV